MLKKALCIILTATLMIAGLSFLAYEDACLHEYEGVDRAFKIMTMEELAAFINEFEQNVSVTPLYETCCDRPAQYYKLGLEAHGRDPDTNYCSNIILSWYRTCRSCGIVYDADAIFTTRPGCGYGPCVPLYP